MFTAHKKVLIALAVIGLVAPIAISTPAQAETFVLSSAPLTNLDPAGDTINGGFTKFPTKAGMYIQQCIAPVGTARPVTCSDTLQLWVTAAGGPGTTSPTGAIAMKVAGSITGKGVTVDCTTNQCGLFFRFDHTAPTDTSEDKFLPITFKQGVTAAALAADEITVTLNGTPLVRNVPSNLAYRADAKIVATAKSGLAVTLTSLTPDCSYANGSLTALKGAGQCALAYATAGNTTTAAASGNFPFILTPGAQKIGTLPKSLKAGVSKALPKSSNFGEVIMYKSASKSCSIKANVLKASKPGTCVLDFHAAEKAGMWQMSHGSVKIAIK
jgi:predicted secreted protein